MDNSFFLNDFSTTQFPLFSNIIEEYPPGYNLIPTGHMHADPLCLDEDGPCLDVNGPDIDHDFMMDFIDGPE